MDKKVQLKFGDMVFGAFPYAEVDVEKSRWVMVLADLGENVVVAYCTTNPDWPQSVRLGQVLPGGKCCYFLPYRWEIITKERLRSDVVKLYAPVPGRGADIVRGVLVVAKRWLYKEMTPRVEAAAMFYLERGKKLAAKKKD